MSTATLNWSLPTTRTDGSPLAASDIASIDVFDANATDPTAPLTTIQGAATSFTTGTLADGPHSFTVVLQDTAGHRSDPSNAASVTVVVTPPPVANPSPVTDLTATLNP